MALIDKIKQKPTYDTMVGEFIADVRSAFSTLSGEVSERNDYIRERDEYIYGDRLEKSIDIPIGHDFTPVNWLRRTVEIHKNMFMSRGFQVVSTYDSQDPSGGADEEDQGRVNIENKRQKEFAESRKALIDAIVRDNGGDALWSTLAENASATGTAAIKAWYNEDEEKYELIPIEAVENLYVLWKRDNFREYDAVAYVFQVSKSSAIKDYGAPEDVATSPLGAPLEVWGNQTGPAPYTQEMVTIMEVTGKVPGWGSDKGRCKKVALGKENEINAFIVGNKLTRIIDNPKKIPRYYILPNKRQRRRPWGVSDVSDAAININITYVETLSDWRTVSSKVNFPKYKAYGFGPDTQLPKSEPRKIQMVPLSEEQDIQEIPQGDSSQFDFRAQMEEEKEQFVRETGLSRVLFDDPSVTLNSNQALLTSMKPTSDIAEAKKQLWAPILVQIFADALDTIAQYQSDIKDLVDEEENWTLKIMWPSVMQKEDPVYQSMILNRFNAGLMSVQSYMEAQGDSKEEIDRMRDEADDPLTSAILGKQLPLYAQQIINFATAQLQAAYMATLPQKEPASGTGNTPGINSNGGGAAMIGPDNEVTGGVGMQPVSQPSTGATAAGVEGAVAQVNQNAGG